MKKIIFLSIIAIAIVLFSCSTPLIQKEGRNVKIADELFNAHADFDSSKPIIYTIDTAYIGKLLQASGDEEKKLLNLQNDAKDFGIAKGKPGGARTILGVAKRPFDVFQADFQPGTNIILQDKQGKPKIKPLFRVNTVPQIGFNLFVNDKVKTKSKIPERTEIEKQKIILPQRGPNPEGIVAVEYILKAEQTRAFEDQADNRFRMGTMYKISWDKQAYPDMYKILQRDQDGQKIKENLIKNDDGYIILDSRYGDYLQFHYKIDGRPTVALYNFDKPDALSLIGLEPVGERGWFVINPEYSNYHGSGWHEYGRNYDEENELEDSINEEDKEVYNSDFDQDVSQYWDYPEQDPLNYPKGPRRLTKKIISQDYPNGRIQFNLSLLKRYSPNFFDELWQKGWIYPHQDSFSIDPVILKRYFPEVVENLDNLYPDSWRYIKTKNPILRKKSREKKDKIKQPLNQLKTKNLKEMPKLKIFPPGEDINGKINGEIIKKQMGEMPDKKQTIDINFKK